jgi:hypothetical protein
VDRRTFPQKKKWIEGQSITSLAPDLLIAVDRRAFRVCTVAQALQNDRWVTDITGSLSVLGLRQYLVLWECIQTFNRVESAPDGFCWKWTTSNQYSASSTHRAFLHRADQCPRRQGAAQSQGAKFFMWLAILGRCWTSELLQRRSLPNSGACTLCSQSDELLSHLLLTCVYIRVVGRVVSKPARSSACSLVLRRSSACGGSGATSRSTNLCARGLTHWSSWCGG